MGKMAPSPWMAVGMKLAPTGTSLGLSEQHPGQLLRVHGKGAGSGVWGERRVSGGSWAALSLSRGACRAQHTQWALSSASGGMSGLGREGRGGGTGVVSGVPLGVRRCAAGRRRTCGERKNRWRATGLQVFTLPNFRPLVPGLHPAQVWGDGSREQELCGPLTEIWRPSIPGTPGPPHRAHSPTPRRMGHWVTGTGDQ